MKGFSVRMICVIAIALILFSYNTVLGIRDKDDQIAKMQADIETLEAANEFLSSAGGSGAPAEASGSTEGSGSGADSASAAASGSGSDADSSGQGVYKDGTYTGSAEGYGGTVTMEVVIENGRIVSINALSHSGEDAEYWAMTESIVPSIIEAQTSDVDTVSGATFSSVGIINAVTSALEQAL